MKMSADEKHLLLTLYNGRTFEELQKQKTENRTIKTYPHQRSHFEHQELIIEMTGFGLNRTDENLFRNSFQMLNVSQLQHFEDSLEVDLDNLVNDFHATIDQTLVRKSKNIMIKRSRLVEDSLTTALKEEDLEVLKVHVDSAYAQLNQLEQRRAITQAINFARSNKGLTTSHANSSDWKISKLRRYQIEIHRKYTYSLLCLIFFFIGAPLGAIIRKGGLGMPVIISVLLFLIYYVISMLGEKVVRENVLPPFAGMWISTFILVPVSIWLTIKAANDSVILNVETYFLWAKKLYQGTQKFFRRR
jgi:lipopolysaccharide export system permease protein